jgi:hypothetical protein
MKKKSKLVQVGELAVGFSENILPDTNDLNGKHFKLFFENDVIKDYQFQDEHILTWKITDSSEVKTSNLEIYRATCPRKNIYFIDFIKKSERATSVKTFIPGIVSQALKKEWPILIFAIILKSHKTFIFLFGKKNLFPPWVWLLST